MRLTVFIEREGNGYVSLCPELDIASQGETVEESLDAWAWDYEKEATSLEAIIVRCYRNGPVKSGPFFIVRPGWG